MDTKSYTEWNQIEPELRLALSKAERKIIDYAHEWKETGGDEIAMWKLAHAIREYDAAKARYDEEYDRTHKKEK